MTPIFIVGASGHAKVVVDLILKGGVFEVAGFIDRNKETGSTFLDFEVLGEENDLPHLRRGMGVDAVFVAIGCNVTRRKVVAKLRELDPGLRFPALAHPSAQVSHGVELGEGAVLMPGSVVNYGSRVGAFCIVNTNASLDHDSRMGDFSSLAPGAVTGGNVAIGSGSAVGLGASIIHGISIGSNVVVGAGATVVRPVQNDVVVFGTPAKVQRSRAADEPVYASKSGSES